MLARAWSTAELWTIEVVTCKEQNEHLLTLYIKVNFSQQSLLLLLVPVYGGSEWLTSQFFSCGNYLVSKSD